MHYSPETVVELERGHQDVLGELEDLWLPLARDLVRSLTNERAQEYLVHGIYRRLITIGTRYERVTNRVGNVMRFAVIAGLLGTTAYGLFDMLHLHWEDPPWWLLLVPPLSLFI